MNYDLNILWIEDSKDWLETTQEWFLSKTEEYGLMINFKILSSSKEIEILPESIKNEVLGFKLYDIIFVDFNISDKIDGAMLIEDFRNSNIDADILFYSDKLKTEELKEKMNNLEFSGIYVSKKDNFQEMAINLFEKNTRRLTSLLNIRGLLTDKTSENDYVVKSYLLEKYDKLSDENKKIVSEKIKLILANNLNTINTKSEEVKKLCDGNVSIKKIIKLMDVFFSILDKYHIFEFILGLNNDMTFAEHSIDDYAEKIIKMRNKVAHKKIDICKRQNYLKYYDILEQYRERTCPDNCSSDECPTEVSNNNISLDDWKETLKLANEYSKLFDKILKELETETDSPEQ